MPQTLSHFSAVFLLSHTLSGTPANADPMIGDGPGCKDKATAEKLVALKDTDPDYVAIWATGMLDQSCRGYAKGVDVQVDDRTEMMACVRAADDNACFWVTRTIAPN